MQVHHQPVLKTAVCVTADGSGHSIKQTETRSYEKTGSLFVDSFWFSLAELLRDGRVAVLDFEDVLNGYVATACPFLRLLNTLRTSILAPRGLSAKLLKPD